MNRMRRRCFCLSAGLGAGLLVICTVVLGMPVAWADSLSDTDREIEELKARLERLEKRRAEEIDRLEEEVSELKVEARERAALEVKEPNMDFVITGYAHTLFRKRQGEDSTFLLGSFNPILLARYKDRVLFEGELEFELEKEEDGSVKTEVAIEYAQIDYIAHDYITLIAGRFVLPLGTFNEKLHPAWINKLPNGPLPYAGHDSGLLPFNDIGFQVRGGVPVGDMRLNYSVYVANGPDEGHHEEEHADEEALASGPARGVAEEDEEIAVRFNDNVIDNNSDKAFGGRIGFLPIPGVEVGFSGTTGRYDDGGDLAFSAMVIDGVIQHFGFAELRGEYIRTWQERDLESTLDREGFWVQGALKVSGIPSDAIQDRLDAVPFVRRFEPVLRYSEINSDEEEADQEQLSVGFVLYLTNTLLAKASYDFNWGESSEAGDDAVYAQLAFGW